MLEENVETRSLLHPQRNKVLDCENKSNRREENGILFLESLLERSAHAIQSNCKKNIRVKSN